MRDSVPPHYFPSLDGLRAVAVSMVICNHLGVKSPDWLHGYLGVDVFFVLSGFLITTLMLRERESTGRVSLGSFYIRRSFRIIPAYLVTILIYAIVVRVLRDPLKAAQFDSALPWLLTFMREFAPASAGNVMGHAWSLGVEEKFYLIWPVLLIALFPFRGRSALWLGLLCVGVFAAPAEFSRPYGGLMAGVLLAIALGSATRWHWLERAPKIPESLIWGLVAVTYLLVGIDSAFVPLFSLAIALLVGSLVRRDGPLRKMLETRVLVFVGRRSYSLYLVHVLVANAVARVTTAPWWMLALYTFALSLLAASTLYVLVERPLIRLGHTLAARTAAPPPKPLLARRES